ncbi:hypothetical protein GPECTOR_1g214 [Gonium pectorale]|uniref:Uncharacterized protein n=1 Tax=Gonium pectorale TaxID=33097 RepID=A0A150H265_GONPE|nr:hypothetical protein GPECTOR_1g214 [Gonium pectorale]|eukprot:KXZ56246.1 hypothetical protein GPECTOR_1g214 [Gonium pectorale]
MARAAQAQGSSAELVNHGPNAGVAAAAGAGPLFSYLGLGSRNSDTFLEAAAAGAAGPSGGAAFRGPSGAGGAAQALLSQLQKGLKRIGSSLEELAYDGAAESMPGWDASQTAGMLMVMALIRRRPEDGWLREYWSVSANRMPEFSAADLAMLSFGISELELQPPHDWSQALLAATLRLAEAPAEAATAADAVATAAAAGGGSPRGSRAAGAGLPGGGVFQALLQRMAPADRGPSAPPAAGGASGAHGGPPAGLEYASTAAATGGSDLDSPALWLPAKHAEAASRDLTAAGGARAAPPLNSAYDMEDLHGGAHGETSSSMASLLLEPVQALWRGVRSAAASVTSNWQRGRNASDLVTVLYNAVSAGLPVTADWLGGFLEAMRGRLQHLSGEDLSCLLSVAVEEGCGVGRGGCLLEPSREWQAALYARMDGVNWSLQSRHLVECLCSITTMGLRPPVPWLRRQLLTLQPSLPLLPNASLVQLAAMLPALPLQPPDAVAASAGVAAASAAALASPSAPPPAAAAAVAASVGAETGHTVAAAVGSAPSTLNIDPTAATATTDTSGAGDAGADRWLAAWLADFRAVAAERRDTMTPSELVNVVLGVSAVTAVTRGSAVPEAASALRLRSVALSFDEWRRAMVAAVAARVPDSSLSGLCEAWQALAEAESQLGEGEGGAATAAATTAAAATVKEGRAAGSMADELSELRSIVAEGMATFHAQQLTTTDVAPVLSSLAAAGLPLPGTTLDSLLSCAQPLLPGLTSAELVTVALSLVRLSHKPNLAWQAAFCAATRRRLGLMTPQQRCSLLVASASLGLHLPDPWVRDFFAISERSANGAVAGGSGCDEQQLSAPQLANLLWAVSCVAPEAPASWLERWEYASMPRLRELGPNMLAVVLKAMATLNYRPSNAWQSAYFAALQRRLFAAGAAQLRWPTPEPVEDGATLATAQQPGGAESDGAPVSTETLSIDALGPKASGAELASTATLVPLGAAAGGAAPGPAPGISSRPATPPSPSPSSSSSSSSSSAGSSGAGGGMLSAAVTAEALNSVVYSLASLDLAPPGAWLDELMDGVRCKLSLLSTLDLSVVLAYLVSRGHRPNDEWWESFLEAFEGRFESLAAGELSSLLIMLNALKVSPTAHWLDSFCSATEPRLGLFQPPQLLQASRGPVLSCLHLFRHRPGQSWMTSYMAAVEASLGRFTPTELARVLMLLDHLNQRPGADFMARFYDTSRPGLAQLDTQELVNVAWAVVSCAVEQPDVSWTDALVEAARPRLSNLHQPQLRVLVAALGHMQRGAPSSSAADFLAFAREFLVV